MFIKTSNVSVVNSLTFDEFVAIECGIQKSASLNHKANINLLDNDIFKKVSQEYKISNNPRDYVFAVARGVTTLVEDKPLQTVNGNCDSFPREELLRKRSDDVFVYQTFNLRPFHTEHKADDPTKASGFLLDSHYNQGNPTDEHVNIVVCCDKTKDPNGANGILTGSVKTYSMGCNVDYTTCSVCANKATKKAEYCNHVRYMKGEFVRGKYVYEKCYGVEFTELSKVRNPADKSATTQEVLSKAASVATSDENVKFYVNKKLRATLETFRDIDELKTIAKVLGDDENGNVEVFLNNKKIIG